MGLYLEVEQPDGVTVSYHRVVRIDSVINEFDRVEVASYTNRSVRERQKLAVMSDEDMPVQPYIGTSYYMAGYGEVGDATGAYGYLKSLPEFSGAQDVFEEGQEAQG